MKIVILLSSIILLSTSNSYAKSSSAAVELFNAMDMKGTMSKTVDKIFDQQI